MHISPIKNIRGLLIDMDGVLWRGPALLVNLPSLLAQIRNKGIQYLFVTNNATRTPADYVDKFKTFGADISVNDTLTSALATAQHIKEQHPAAHRVYVIGESGLQTALQNAGLEIVQQRPDIVVVGMDRNLNYASLSQATLHIRQGIPFIGTNPDKSFPLPEGLAPGAGAILALLEAATDIAPLVIGKPNPLIYQMALSKLGFTPEETLVIGDRLETDILGGSRAGCRTAVVLSGVSTREQAEAYHPRPDMIYTNIELLVKDLA